MWRLLDGHFERFRAVYAERYEKRYGFWRPVVERTVEKFLACGDLREGFARVRCADCHHEFFVAFSCRRRCLCPSCHQKRSILIAEHIASAVCQDVGHRQYVFTIPKRLRLLFRFDRRLLGELPRLAWRAVLEVYRTVLDRPDAVPAVAGVAGVPGAVAAIQTFGELVHWHPHVHALVTDGVFAPDGTFISLPPLETTPFERLWQRGVFDLLLRRGKIQQRVVDQMRCWRHSGFSVHNAVRIGARDVAGRERLLRYMLRCPFSLERFVRLTEQGKVLYRAGSSTPRRFPRPDGQSLLPGVRPGVARNFQIADALDFIAEITQHIPEPRKHLSRCFGWYSSKARGRRAKAQALVGLDARHHPADQLSCPTPHLARRRWAALLQRIWQVDPLRCPRCGCSMKIIAFIQARQRQVIQRILSHCGLWEHRSRAPPPPSISSSLQPDPPSLRYVTDPHAVDVPPPPPEVDADLDPAPPWHAD